MNKRNILLMLTLMALLTMAVSVSAGGYLTPASLGTVSGVAQNVTVNLTALVSNLSNTQVTLVYNITTPLGTQNFVQAVTNTTPTQRLFEFSFNTTQITFDRQIFLTAIVNFTNGTAIEAFTQTNYVGNSNLANTVVAPINGKITSAKTTLFNVTTNEEVTAMTLTINGRTFAMTTEGTTGRAWTYTPTYQSVPDGNYVWAATATELGGSSVSTASTQLRVDAEKASNNGLSSVTVDAVAKDVGTKKTNTTLYVVLLVVIVAVVWKKGR